MCPGLLCACPSHGWVFHVLVVCENSIFGICKAKAGTKSVRGTEKVRIFLEKFLLSKFRVFKPQVRKAKYCFGSTE